jgi:hypothetical protein
MNKLYSNNNHPELNIKNTGFKDAIIVKNTLNIIKNRSILYQKSVIITMYNRAKYHPYITPEMKEGMKIMKKWLIDNKNKSYKYEYLTLDIIKKYEKLADKYDVSRVSRGIDKSSKSDHGFLTIYKQYGKSKMPFIPIFKKDPTRGDYDIFREKYLKAKLGQMKKMNIQLYDTDNLPTKFHLSLIMNAYSPDKKLYSK